MNNQDLNYLENGIKIINITPVEIKGHDWYLVGFEPEDVFMGDAFHLLLVRAEIKEPKKLLYAIKSYFKNRAPITRIHSECLLGDAFSSSLCDCGEQLNYAIDRINKVGSGIIVYLRQEGRGIGLRAKLACLAIQEGYIRGELSTAKLSSDDANLYFGYDIDLRNYSIAAGILRIFNISKVILLTGNSDKITTLYSENVDIIGRYDTPFTFIHNSRKHKEIREKIKRGYVYNFGREIHEEKYIN